MHPILRRALAAALLFATAASAEPPPATQRRPALVEVEERVLFNTRTHKFHCASCDALSRCTHCQAMPRSEALRRGGVPCKRCGGSCAR